MCYGRPCARVCSPSCSLALQVRQPVGMCRPREPSPEAKHGAEAYPVSEAEDQPQDGVLKKRPREDAAPLHRHATAPTLSSSAKVLSRPLKHARTAPSAVGGGDGSVFPLTRIELTPDWLIYNESVHTGYRQWDVSVGAALRSLFQIHNETGNIWTHMLGLVGFIALGWHTMAHGIPEAAPLERLAIAAMFFGVITCMAFSVVYHTFNSVSRPVHDALLRLDYTGITVQIFTSFVPVVTYSHYCDVQLQQRYLQCLGTVVLGSLSVIQLFLFGHASRRPARTAVFTAVGALGGAPVVHHLVLSWGTAAWWPAVQLLLSAAAMGALFAVGGCIYVVRVPERWAPGRFDLWLNSHQLFHLLTVVAATMHFLTVMASYRLWHDPHRADVFRCGAAPGEPYIGGADAAGQLADGLASLGALGSGAMEGELPL